MAELPRYKQQTIRTEVGGREAIRAGSQMISTLADRISSFKGPILQEYAQETEVQAKNEANKAFSEKGLQAEINNEMTVYGRTYTNALTNMHKKKLAIDTGIEFQNLYNKHKNNPLAFNQASDAVYKETLKLLPEHLRAEYAIDFESNKAHYAGQVSQNRIKLDKERDFALTNDLLTQSTEKASRASREGNQSLALYEIDKGIRGLDSALENGTITAEQHRKGIQNIKFQSSTAMFKGINDKHIESGNLTESQDYIDEFRRKDVQGFTDGQREALADDMQSDLNKQIRQEKAMSDANKKEATMLVKDAIKILKTGKKPDDMEAVEQSAIAVSPELQHELQVHNTANNYIRKVDYLSLPEQMAVVNAMESKPTASRVEIEALSQAKKNLTEKMAMAEKDPYSLGAQDGLYEQAGVLLPSQGVQALAQILPIRAKQSSMAQSAYGTQQKLFTDAEAQQYSSWLENPATSIEDKLDLISAIETSVPNDSNSVYSQFMKKGASVFSFAGSMVKKGDRQKAEMMLRGQIILREQPGVVPTDDMNWKLNGTIGNAMRYQGAGSRKALSEATTAYYASLAEQEGKLSKEQAPLSLVKQAVNDVSGGIGMKNEQNYFLPPEATENDVEDWIDGLSEKDFQNVSGVTPKDAVDIINRGQLISVGEGMYQVIFQGKRLMSQDGKPLVMEYTK